jgi:hypothetical protein
MRAERHVKQNLKAAWKSFRTLTLSSWMRYTLKVSRPENWPLAALAFDQSVGDRLWGVPRIGTAIGAANTAAMGIEKPGETGLW